MSHFLVSQPWLNNDFLIPGNLSGWSWITCTVSAGWSFKLGGDHWRCQHCKRLEYFEGIFSICHWWSHGQFCWMFCLQAIFIWVCGRFYARICFHFRNSSCPHSCTQETVPAGTKSKDTTLCVLIHYVWEATTISLESILSPRSAFFHSFISPLCNMSKLFLTPSVVMNTLGKKNKWRRSSLFSILSIFSLSGGWTGWLAPRLITTVCLLP